MNHYKVMGFKEDLQKYALLNYSILIQRMKEIYLWRLGYEEEL